MIALIPVGSSRSSIKSWSECPESVLEVTLLSPPPPVQAIYQPSPCHHFIYHSSAAHSTPLKHTMLLCHSLHGSSVCVCVCVCVLCTSVCCLRFWWSSVLLLGRLPADTSGSWVAVKHPVLCIKSLFRSCWRTQRQLRGVCLGYQSKKVPVCCK